MKKEKRGDELPGSFAVLGRFLQARREELGKSLEQLRDESGLSLATLQKLESGKGDNPRGKTLRSLAPALRASEADLKYKAGYFTKEQWLAKRGTEGSCLEPDEEPGPPVIPIRPPVSRVRPAGLPPEPERGDPPAPRLLESGRRGGEVWPPSGLPVVEALLEIGAAIEAAAALARQGGTGAGPLRALLRPVRAQLEQVITELEK